MSLPAILYDNRLDDGTQVATTTAANYAAKNLSDLRPYTYWKGTGGADQYITVDCGSAKSADSLGIIGHDLFTQGATIAVQYSTDNINWYNVLFDGVDTDFTPTNNKIIYKEFVSLTKQYWRLKIAASYAAPPFIGVLVIGSRMQFLDGFENTGNFDPDAHTLEAVSQNSQNGNLLGVAIGYKKLNINISFKYIASSFVDGALKTFIDTHGLKPFFWVWDHSGHPQVYFVALPPGFNKNFPFSSGTTLRNVHLKFIGVLE